MTTREAVLEDIRAEVDACNSRFLSDADTTTVDEDHVAPLLRPLSACDFSLYSAANLLHVGGSTKRRCVS